MNVNLLSGWVEALNRVETPNYNQRPDAKDISLLVIHCISLPPGQYGSSCIDDFFCNRLAKDAHPYFLQIADIKVSSHFLIRRNGEITQYVSVLNRAWHAGLSSFEGRENCNDYSIGIELEGLEGDAFEGIQYKKLIELSGLLITTFPAITPDRIVAHSDIAPGRKQDPGEGFEWRFFRKGLDEFLSC